ncbi:MAG: RHS repeat-associated core domain-containing protein, partial [Actinomycetota bacterium]
SGTDGLISATTSAGTSYLSYNPHSDLSLVTDQSAAPIEQLHGDAWGNKAEPTDQPYTYLGKHQRPDYGDIGLIRMGARLYDPETGRFTTKDPLQGTEMHPIGQNPYAYANDDPVNMNDLAGLMAVMGELNPLGFCQPSSSTPNLTPTNVVPPDVTSYADMLRAEWHHLNIGGIQEIFVRASVSYQTSPSDSNSWLIKYAGWRVRYQRQDLSGVYPVIVQSTMLWINSKRAVTRLIGREVPHWGGDPIPEDVGPGEPFENEEFHITSSVMVTAKKGQCNIIDMLDVVVGALPYAGSTNHLMCGWDI